MSRPPCSINGQTRLVGIIGWPVGHSLSPRMHNAAFAALGLNFAYVPLPVAPGQVEAAIRGLLALGFVGANVTVPHKSAVMPYADELTPAARAIGAVNTLVARSDGTLLGDNTDAYGFSADLRAHGVAVGPGRRALVIGAGGGARAVAYALAAAGTTVAVANRTFSKAEELCRGIGQAVSALGSAGSLSPYRFPDDLPGLAHAADLVVNATALGLRGEQDPLPWDASATLRPGQIVYDLVYPSQASDEWTPFLRLAAAQGARAISGTGMLIHQGARAFELWTGVPAPVEVMAASLGKAAAP